MTTIKNSPIETQFNQNIERLRSDSNEYKLLNLLFESKAQTTSIRKVDIFHALYILLVYQFDHQYNLQLDQLQFSSLQSFYLKEKEKDHPGPVR